MHTVVDSPLLQIATDLFFLEELNNYGGQFGPEYAQLISEAVSFVFYLSSLLQVLFCGYLLCTSCTIITNFKAKAGSITKSSIIKEIKNLVTNGLGNT